MDRQQHQFVYGNYWLQANKFSLVLRGLKSSMVISLHSVESHIACVCKKVSVGFEKVKY